MSLSQYNVSLTSSAKAQGTKLVIKIIRSLDSDRGSWLADTVFKATLLGQHDTIRTQWVAIDEETCLKVTGTTLRTANASSTSRGKASSSTSGREAGTYPENLQSARKSKASSSSVERQGEGGTENKDPSAFASGRLQQLEGQFAARRNARAAAAKSKPPTTTVRTDAGQERELDAENQNANAIDDSESERARARPPYPSVQAQEDEEREENELHFLRAELERTAVMTRIRAFEFSQRLMSVPVTQNTDKHHRGLYGLREGDVVENLINAEYGKQRVFQHPVSGREETQTEREVRMILYNMIITSLQNFKSMYTGELVGDNYAIVRNVMKFGAPNSMKMKIDLTKRLGNYSKKPEQGYQEYELGLRTVVDELATVGNPVSSDDVTLRLIAGMMSDKRYDKESKEASDYAEPYSVCNNVYLQRAMALGNITSKRKEKAEEANAADEPDKKGGDGRRGRGGKGGKGGKEKRDRGPKGGRGGKRPCTAYLTGDCTWGKDCYFEHISIDDLKKQKKKTKKKKKKDDKSDDQKTDESNGSDSEGQTREKKKTKKKTKKHKKGDKNKSDQKVDQLCFQYQEKGSCHRGDSCKFSHDVAHQSEESQESNMVVLVDGSDDDNSHSSTDTSSSTDISGSSSTDTDTSADESSDTETESILSQTVIKESGIKSQRSPIRGGSKGGRTVSSKNPNAPKPCTLDSDVCRKWLSEGECFDTKCQYLHPVDRMFDTPVWSKRLARKEGQDGVSHSHHGPGRAHPL